MKDNEIVEAAQLEKHHVNYLVKWLNQRPSGNILRLRNMTNIHQQEMWADSALRSSLDYYRLFVINGEAIGFGGIEGIDWLSRKATAFVVLDKQSVESNEMQAFRALLNLAFKVLGLNKVSLDIVAERPSLIKNLEKIGFVKEVRKRQHYFYDKSYHHVIEIAILAAEYKSERPRDSTNSN